MSSRKKPITKREFIDERKSKDANFYRVLSAEDDLGVVIRAHIYVEEMLHEFIEAAAPEPRHIKFEEFSFDKTIRLALILGLPANFKATLSALGNLRNKFAHSNEASLGNAETNNLYNSLDGEAKGIAQRTYRKMLEKFPDRPKRIAQLSPRERFALIVVTLRAGIAVSTANVMGLAD